MGISKHKQTFMQQDQPFWVNEFIEKGKGYAAEEKFDLAKEMFCRILGVDAVNEEALFELGKVHYILKEYAKAEEILSGLYHRSSMNRYALLLLGKTYKEVGKQKQAREVYEDMVKRGLSDDEVYMELGALYRDEEEYELSITAYKKLLRRDSENQQLNENVARMYMEMKNYKLAIRHFKKVCKGNSEIMSARMGLADAYAQQGKHDKVQKELEMILAAEPGNNAIRIKLARSYRDTGRRKSAVKGYKKAIKMFSQMKGDVFLHNKILNEYETYERRTVLESKPRSLIVTLTNKCNLKCLMCDVWKSPRWDIDISTVKEIKGLMPYLQNIVWQGGEVFFSEYFEELLEQAVLYPRLKQFIVTNGLLINDYWAKSLNRKNIYITISIDGVRKSTYENIRRSAKYSKLVENLELLNKYRFNDSGDNVSGLKVNMQMVVSKENYLDLEYVSEFMVKYKINSLQLIPLRNGIKEDNVFYFDDNNARYIRESVKNVVARGNEYGYSVLNLLPISNNGNASSEVPQIRKEKSEYRKCEMEITNGDLHCLWPWQQLIIASSGDVIVHCFCENTIGNISESKLCEIWNNERMQLLRQNMLKNDYHDCCSYRCVSGIIGKEELRLQED